MTARSQGQPDLPPEKLSAADITARVAQLYEQHGDQLRRFLWGVLRDNQLAADCVQAVFVKLIESDGPDREEAEKAWLFRVAYHQALAIRRREAVGEKVSRQVAHGQPAAGDAADRPLIEREQQQRIRAAVRQLPPAQQEIVRMRMYENKTFAQIAAELGIPLGTALSRMRAALQKLRSELGEQP